MSEPASKTAEEVFPACAVEAMLDRPVAQSARFVGACAVFWIRGLHRPWRLGQIHTEDIGAPPPFAWLIASLFVAGVAFRLWFAIDAVPHTEEVSLIADLQTAIGELSLPRVLMVTLPCVLMVTLAAALFSRLIGGDLRLDTDPLVAASCYAIGWQFGLVALFFAVLTILQIRGHEPTGALNDELNTILPFVALVTLSWGALILLPALKRRIHGPGFWTWPLGFIGSACLTAPLFVAAMWVLGQSVDLSAAAELAEARKMRSWFGELDVDLLRKQRLIGGQYEVTIAYTSRSYRLLLIPRCQELVPEGAGDSFQVVHSSLDEMPDRALLVEPGQTRVAEYTLRPIQLIGKTLTFSKKNPAYPLTYFRRERDGIFNEGKATLHAKLAPSSLQIGSAPNGDLLLNR